MKQDEFLKKLVEEGYPTPKLITRNSFGFLDLDACPYEVVALVIEGQIDISINGYRAAYLAGDCFYLPENRLMPNASAVRGFDIWSVVEVLRGLKVLRPYLLGKSATFRGVDPDIACP